jgi:ribonuclease Z
MSLQLIFLGTAGGVPTPKRGLPAIVLRRKDEQLMFDCGEGAQRQMAIAKTGFHRITKVFITHMHGDHVLGLPGLLQTMAMLDRQRKLDVYGPKGIRAFLQGIRETVPFVLTFPIEIHEIEKEGLICKEKEYSVQATWSNHAVTSLAYAFAEEPRPGRFHPEKAKELGLEEGPLWSKLQQGHRIKLPSGKTVKPEDVMGRNRLGRKIVYVGDTRPFNGLAKFAAGADILIHDSTLDNELTERAKAYGHSTASQAARDAKKAKVKQLILTHISSRYSEPDILLKQAKKIFKNTLVAEDFMRKEIPFQDERK